MRGNGGEPTEIPLAEPRGDLALMCALAGIGFACLIGWELSLVFGPALPLLSYCGLQTAILMRGASVAALAATFAFCAWKPAWVFERTNQLLALAFALSLPTIACAAVQPVGAVWAGCTALAWAMLGLSQGFMMVCWCLFFSRISTEHTVITIAWSACGGTLLFALVGWSGSAAVSLVSITCFALASAGLAAFLLNKLDLESAMTARSSVHGRAVSVPAALSVGCHGAVFGYMSIALCSLGEQAAVIGGASGIVGCLMALLWGFLGARIELDAAISQRISLPLIVAGVLLFQIADGAGKVAAGCLVIAALAHSSIVTWYTTCTENYRFHLSPIDRFALRQFPSWVGFLAGVVIAYLTITVWSLSDEHYLLFASALVIIVVTAYACYGGGVAGTHQHALASEGDERVARAATEAPAPSKTPAAPFRARCQSIAERYGLTPREAEVLVLLAKGRNAEYISNELVVSASTVKSHIYHIYRKMGINSQQSLINIVEGEREPESPREAEAARA